MDDSATSSMVDASQPDAVMPATTTPAPESDALELAAVKRWIAKIKAAKRYYENDIKRIESDMEFAAGLQWTGQQQLNSNDKVIVNLVIRNINQKVAQLYARDPKAVAKRRKRMDFQFQRGNPFCTLGIANVAKALDIDGRAICRRFGSEW